MKQETFGTGPWRSRVTAMFAGLGLVAAATTAHAATPVNSLRLSPDVTIFDGPRVEADESYVVEIFTTPLGLLQMPVIPAAAELDALTKQGDDTVFSVDTTAVVGSVVARPADLVSFDGTTYQVVFDSMAEGIVGADIDAVTDAGNGELLVSFDTTVLLGGSLVAHDEDIVRITATSFALELDGVAAGIDPALDVDGLHHFPSGRILVSFDTSGSVGGVTFDDEDLLEYAPASDAWELAFDASATASSDWTLADLTAIWADRPLRNPRACGLGPEVALLLLPYWARLARQRGRAGGFAIP